MSVHNDAVNRRSAARRRARRWLLGAAILIPAALVATLASVAIGVYGKHEQASDPERLARAYVDRFNAHDADGMQELTCDLSGFNISGRRLSDSDLKRNGITAQFLRIREEEVSDGLISTYADIRLQGGPYAREGFETSLVLSEGLFSPWRVCTGSLAFDEVSQKVDACPLLTQTEIAALVETRKSGVRTDVYGRPTCEWNTSPSIKLTIAELSVLNEPGRPGDHVVQFDNMKGYVRSQSGCKIAVDTLKEDIVVELTVDGTEKDATCEKSIEYMRVILSRIKL